MKKRFETKTLALLGLLSALLLIMAYTPLGYLNIGPLAITFNTIPVAIAAYALGTAGGAVIGGVFGLTSFLQCFGISKLGTALFAISPALTAFQCFVPRILEGLVIGFVASKLRRMNAPVPVGSSITGFGTAFLNTLFYMTSLMILFGNSSLIQDYWKALAPDSNVIVFVAVFVGVNAVVEWISTSIITCAVCTGLKKAGFICAKAV